MPTLASLIRDVAHLCGAVMHESTATSGTTTTLVDNVELSGFADDTFNDKRLYIYAGAGLGQERRITDHTGASGTLTTPTMTAPDATTKYIILESPWTAAQIRSALLTSMRLHRRDLLEPMVDESLTISSSPTITYGYTVPTGFAAIQQIWRENEVSGGLFTYPIPWDAWWIDRSATKKIVFEKLANDLHSFLLNGAKLRVVGQKYETEPDSDDDVVSVQTGGLITFSAVLALLGRVATDPTNARRYTATSSMLLQEYQRSHRDDVQRVWPQSRMVEE